MIRRLVLLFSSVALVTTACSSASSDERGGGQAELELQLEMAAHLETFDDCDDLLEHLRETTVEMGPNGLGGMVAPMPTRRVIRQSAGVESGAVAIREAVPDAVGATPGAGDVPVSSETPVPVFSAPDVPVPEPGVPVPDLPEPDLSEPQVPGSRYVPDDVDDIPGGQGGEEPPEFSGTNVQEAGVDEPDVVKTDGRRIVALAGGELHVLDPSGGSIEHLGSVALPEHGEELFLHGDRAVVLSRVWDAGRHQERIDARSGGRSVDAVLIGPGGLPLTAVTAVDISDPSEPEVVEERRFEGEYVSARLHEGVIRLVLRSTPEIGSIPMPEPSPDEIEELTRLEREAAGTPFAGRYREEFERERQLLMEDAFEDAVRAMPLEAWLPDAVVGDDGEREALVPCDAVNHPPEPSGTGMVTVLTVEAGGSMEPVDTDAVVADAQTIYASTGTLYVGTSEQSPTGDPGGPPTAVTTALHAFDISDPARTEYVASGRVRGRLLNQWSLSEHDGHLRVATTDGRRGAPDSESFLTVLRREGDRLERVGQVGGLGPSERIFAARFFGDVGFVVTFREVDPLYALDLSDPENPQVVGELKIPGFSNYLHPVGDGLLLGVGQDADERGRTRGTQLSLFDVSDLSDLQRVDVEVIRNGHSDVEFDHRAFLWWPPERLAVIPLEVWDHGRVRPADPDTGDDRAEPFLGAAGFRVEDGTVDPAGRITHSDKVEFDEDPALGGSDTDPTDDVAISDDDDDVEIIELVDPHPLVAPIVRSLVIGDTLYTLSDAGILASTLDGFEERGWAEF